MAEPPKPIHWTSVIRSQPDETHNIRVVFAEQYEETLPKLAGSAARISQLEGELRTVRAKLESVCPHTKFVGRDSYECCSVCGLTKYQVEMRKKEGGAGG